MSKRFTIRYTFKDKIGAILNESMLKWRETQMGRIIGIIFRSKLNVPRSADALILTTVSSNLFSSLSC